MLLLELGLLEEDGRLRNFTALAEAVLQLDEVLGRVGDERTVLRTAKMLDHVFEQAYQGEQPLDTLADRVRGVVEVCEMMAVPAVDTGEAGDYTCSL